MSTSKQAMQLGRSEPCKCSLHLRAKQARATPIWFRPCSSAHLIHNPNHQLQESLSLRPTTGVVRVRDCASTSTASRA
jgi:hypothetical protein